MNIETDYLIVGAGASGMAFADSLLAEADVDVVLVDRRERPGGHWRDAYPFVQLHTPSAYYGVTSTPLGQDRLIESGRNQGFYEQAGAAEICAYFDGVVDALTSNGRARFLGGHDHLGDGRVRDLKHRRRAHGLGAAAARGRDGAGVVHPGHPPAFLHRRDRRRVRADQRPAGGGRAVRALHRHRCGKDERRRLPVAPRPRRLPRSDPLDPTPRHVVQRPGRPAAARPGGRDHVRPLPRRRGRRAGGGRGRPLRPARVVRSHAPARPGGVAHDVPGHHDQPGRAGGLCRTIEDVVRLGKLRSIETNRLVLEQGEVATDSHVFHVDCSALGLREAKPVPTFGPGTITIQQVRQASPTFNAALVAFVEAHRDDDEEKNRLTPTHPYPSTVDDWGRFMSTTWATEMAWVDESDLSAWVAGTRLNLLRDLPRAHGRAARPGGPDPLPAARRAGHRTTRGCGRRLTSEPRGGHETMDP